MVWLVAVLGLIVGALLNFLIDRIPNGETLLALPSCRQCGYRYTILDSLATLRVPVKGVNCPSCRNSVFYRAVAVEISTALLFALLWERAGLSLSLIFFAIYFSIFVVLFFIDLEHRRVPNVILLPAVLFALATGVIQPGIVEALIGGIFGFGILLILYLINPKGIGAGDVKLAALIGLLTGWPSIVIGLLIGFLLGGLGAAVLLASRVVNRKSTIPYAPFLIVGAMIAMLYGNEIIAWYLWRYW